MQTRKISLLLLIMIGLLTIKAQKCGKNQTGLANKLTSVDDDLIKSNIVSNLESQASLPSSESLVSTDLPIIQRLRTTSKMGILTPAEIIQTDMASLMRAENLIPTVSFYRYAHDININVLRMDFDRLNSIVHYELELSKNENFKYDMNNYLTLDLGKDYYFTGINIVLIFERYGHTYDYITYQTEIDNLPNYVSNAFNKPLATETLSPSRVSFGEGPYVFYFNHITKTIKGAFDLKLRREYDHVRVKYNQTAIDNEKAVYNINYGKALGKLNFFN